MSIEQYHGYLREHGASRTGADGGEIALKKADAIKALDLLSDTAIGVLGGDVYKREADGNFRPTYDNWHCDKAEESQHAFAMRSQEAARAYITKYREIQGVDVWYVLVLDDGRVDAD